MKELIYKKGKIVLPESLEELSGKQLIRLAEILFTGGDELKCQVKTLKILSRMSAWKFSFLKPEIINRAIEHIDWVFHDKLLTKQLLPKYKGYYGPASNFDNLRMKEFHMSELYYRELINEKSEQDEGALNNLVAVIYRPAKKGYDKKKDPDGDIRVEFNHNESAFHVKKIGRWPLRVKQAIFLWYDGCRQELIDNNPLVFKEPSKYSFESQFDTGLYGIMKSLAGEKLGDIEKVEQMYVQTAMVNIGLLKEEERFIEEQMKGHN